MNFSEENIYITLESQFSHANLLFYVVWSPVVNCFIFFHHWHFNILLFLFSFFFCSTQLMQTNKHWTGTKFLKIFTYHLSPLIDEYKNCFQKPQLCKLALSINIHDTHFPNEFSYIPTRFKLLPFLLTECNEFYLIILHFIENIH